MSPEVSLDVPPRVAAAAAELPATGRGLAGPVIIVGLLWGVGGLTLAAAYRGRRV